jgi:hypothetical protein
MIGCVCAAAVAGAYLLAIWGRPFPAGSNRTKGR